MAQLFHVGLTVKNLERSLAFYRDVAEMTEEEHLEVRSKAFDTLTNNPGAALKVAHLTAGTFMLQLIEYAAGGGSTLDLHHNNVGSPHMPFYVPDVEAKYKEVQRRGDVKITSGLVQIAPNMRSFYTGGSGRLAGGVSAVDAVMPSRFDSGQATALPTWWLRSTSRLAL